MHVEREGGWTIVRISIEIAQPWGSYFVDQLHYIFGICSMKVHYRSSCSRIDIWHRYSNRPLLVPMRSPDILAVAF